MRIVLFFVLVCCLMPGSASGNMFYVKFHPTEIMVPDSGTALVSVPVSLEYEGGPVPPNLLLESYDIGINVGASPGISFQDDPPVGPSNGDGATNSLAGFELDTNVNVMFASIAVGANADPTSPNITSASTPLFTLDFIVDSTASPQSIPMTLANFSNFPVFRFADDLSTSVNEAMNVENVSLSATSGSLTLMPVPEPSEWILGFMMCMLTGQVIWKKYSKRSPKASH